MSNFPERPALLALALVLTLGSGAPAMADACVSESFLHRMESGIESSETISDQGDAQILGGTGQGLYEVRYLRPDYALTSFHAIGNGEDGGHDAGHNTGGRLYLGYVDYDPALLTGAQLAMKHDLTGKAAIDLVLRYIKQSVPDAIGNLKPSPDVLTDLAKAKLEQVAQAKVKEATGAAVDALSDALRKAGLPAT